jgi:3-phenylpropionate/trans-cinnamate dioxygenase ferredoxin component
VTVVARFDELEPGTARRVEVDGVAVAIVRIDDEVHAIGDTCSHANVSLSEGVVWCDEKQLECPRHGSAFGLLDGRPNTLPATQPVKVYAVRIVEGDVHVEAS